MTRRGMFALLFSPIVLAVDAFAGRRRNEVPGMFVRKWVRDDGEYSSFTMNAVMVAHDGHDLELVAKREHDMNARFFDHRWHHVAHVVDVRGNVTEYIDGRRVTT